MDDMPWMICHASRKLRWVGLYNASDVRCVEDGKWGAGDFGPLSADGSMNNLKFFRFLLILFFSAGFMLPSDLRNAGMKQTESSASQWSPVGAVLPEIEIRQVLPPSSRRTLLLLEADDRAVGDPASCRSCRNRVPGHETMKHAQERGQSTKEACEEHVYIVGSSLQTAPSTSN